METHEAWDFGRINQASRDILSIEPKQKTTKTLCGKRIKMERVSHNPDCPVCQEKIANYVPGPSEISEDKRWREELKDLKARFEELDLNWRETVERLQSER